MKLEVITPDITQYNLKFERADKRYTQCMWMQVNLDNVSWTLTATSDCGNYSYSWYPERHRTFKQLFMGMHKEYFLKKISNETNFDICSTLENLKVYFNSEDEPKLNDFLDGLDYCSSMDELIDEITESEFYELFKCDNLWECVSYDYPRCAKTFTDIFFEYIVPVIIEEH